MEWVRMAEAANEAATVLRWALPEVDGVAHMAGQRGFMG
jgi:hypothetical protein